MLRRLEGLFDKVWLRLSLVEACSVHCCLILVAGLTPRGRNAEARATYQAEVGINFRDPPYELFLHYARSQFTF